MSIDPLNDYRCKCGRLLFKEVLSTCKIEIKCKKCGEIKTIAYNDGASLSADCYVIPAGLGNRVLNDGDKKGKDFTNREGETKQA